MENLPEQQTVSHAPRIFRTESNQTVSALSITREYRWYYLWKI